MTDLESALGSTEYANVVTADPTQRDSSGSVTNAASSPEYNIDYGFMNPLVHLAYPSTINTTYFPNMFDKISISSLTLSNITHYFPGTPMSLFLQVSDDVYDVDISGKHLRLHS